MRPTPKAQTPASDRELPTDLLDAVSENERSALRSLFSSFVDGGGKQIVISTQSQSRPEQATEIVHVVFRDCIGSLGAICAALASRRISISRVNAFTTPSGIAVDTFHVDSFDEEAESVLRSCLHKKLLDATRAPSEGLAILPESYASVTTPAERDAHRRMHAAWLDCGKVGVQLERGEVVDGDGADVLLFLVFRDVEGALAVVTSALASSGVNVKRVAAFCSSNGPVAIDTFQLESFNLEAESTLMEHLTEHLSEIEGESKHGGSAWVS